MSAKSICKEVFGKLFTSTFGGKSAKAIVQDALEQAGLGKETTSPNTEENGNANGGIKTISFTFSLDPEMVKTLGRAMPKGAKPEDRTDNLKPGEQDANPPLVENDLSQSENQNKEDKQQVVQDEAIACDARQTDTPIENCRAEDPMFCPYHGALKMQQMIRDELGKVLNDNDKVSRLKIDVNKAGSEFTVNVSDGTWLMTDGEEKAVLKGLNAFLGTNGIKVIEPPRINNDVTNYGSFEFAQQSASGKFETKPLQDRMPEGYTQADYDIAKMKAGQDLRNEWMDGLIEDFGDPNADVDPADLEALMGMQEQMQALADQGTAQAAEQHRLLRRNFDEKYHDVKGNIDLPQVKSAEDAHKMNEDLYARRKAAGDWWNAKEEIADLRRQLGMTSGTKAISLAKVHSQFPELFDNWEKFKSKYNNLYTGAVGLVNGSGRGYDLGARGKFDSAEEAGDLKRMKGALHTMEYATEAMEDMMPGFLKAMEAHKADLLNYAQEHGIEVKPYQPKDTEKLAKAQNASVQNPVNTESHQVQGEQAKGPVEQPNGSVENQPSGQTVIEGVNGRILSMPEDVKGAVANSGLGKMKFKEAVNASGRRYWYLMSADGNADMSPFGGLPRSDFEKACQKVSDSLGGESKFGVYLSNNGQGMVIIDKNGSIGFATPLRQVKPSGSQTMGKAKGITRQSVQSAFKGVPSWILQGIGEAPDGSYEISFGEGNRNYAQSMIPSIQQRFPGSKVELKDVNGEDYITIS